MAFVHRLITILCGASVLGGCTSFRGPHPIYDSHGLVADRLARPDSGLYILFEKDARTSFAYRDNAAAASNMMTSGFALIHANCNQFFLEMGRNQRRSQITRDLISPITTVLTGILALQNFAENSGTKERMLSIISLGSGAVTSGLDIYDTRFLFGAENISSVQTMTLSALTAHRKTVLGAPPDRFEFAVMQLIDNQNICTPPQILTLVRQSIQAAKPQAGDDDDDGDDSENGGQAAIAPPAPPVVGSNTNTNATDPDANDYHPVSIPPQ